MSDASPRKRYCTRCLTTFEGDPEECPNLACRRKRSRNGWGRIYRSGEVFDRTYRIHDMLAVGGAGVTYVARELGEDNEEVGPRLAVKVLLAARDQGPYVRRLATEAQIIQELAHPNIVQYLGFVHRAGHSPYLLTHYEEGGSLLDHMRRVGTLSVRAACVVGRQICSALEKAHERGIVHRDLKPENVLLAKSVIAGEEPVVRVADFGIAKVRGSLGGGNTRVGAFVGTPLYAAPEQFVGGAISEAADVYGVGALLYFTMMAQHVVRFADRLDPEDSFQLLCDNLPPEVVRDQDPTVDVERMNAILAIAMRVDPASRCNVDELDSLLEALLRDRDPVVPLRLQRRHTTDLPQEGMAEPLPVQTLRASPTLAPDGDFDPTASPSRAPITQVGSTQSGPLASPPVASAPPPSTPPDLEDELASEARAVVLAARPDSPSRTQPLEGAAGTDPAAPADSNPPVPRKRRALRFVLAVLLGGVLLCGGGLAGSIYLVSDLLGLWDAAESAAEEAPTPVPTGAAEPEAPAPLAPPLAADQTAIVESLNQQQARLGALCGVAKGTLVELRLSVEPNGSLRSARALSGGDKGRCLADHIARGEVARAGDGPVALEVGLQW